jgi:hypothetical protein
MSDLVKKLNPRRFPSMSSKMGAIVGCILGEHFTDPAIAELCVTSDGFLLARRSDDVGFNDFLGNERDLRSNWENLLKVAGLAPEELTEAEELYRKHVRRA